MSPSVLVAFSALLLLGSASLAASKELGPSGTMNEAFWDSQFKSCYDKPSFVAPGNTIFDGCYADGTVSTLTTCSREGGVHYRLFFNSKNCTGNEVSRWQAIARCYRGPNSPNALLCPGDNDWSTIKQIDQPPTPASGNVSLSSIPCGGSTGNKCRGPRTLSWLRSDCSGTPQSQIEFYADMVAETCYRWVDNVNPSALGYNIRVSCDALAGTMRINKYNSGCSRTPFEYRELPYGKCLSYGPGLGSYMVLCN